MSLDGTNASGGPEFGAFVLKLEGIEGSKIVDRAMATVLPLAGTSSVYTPTLRWAEDAGWWIAVMKRVVPGLYSVSIDAEVDGVWLPDRESTPMEVVPGVVAERVFRVEDKIRWDHRWFDQQRIYPTEPSRRSLSEAARVAVESSGVVIDLGSRTRRGG